MNETTREVLIGAAAGFAATAPMTAFMDATHPHLPLRERHALPPRHITKWAAQTARVDDQLDEPSLQRATLAAHFGYGASAGALYGVAAKHIPLPPVASGMAFGMAVWAASYLGWLPMAGVLPPATREYAGRNAVMIGAHLVWGGVLGYLASRASRATEANSRQRQSARRPLAKYVAASHQKEQPAKW